MGSCLYQFVGCLDAKWMEQLMEGFPICTNSLATSLHWPLYQLHVKNVFFHGDLQKELYIEQPLGFVT